MLTVQLDTADNGVFADDITADVLALRWRLGMARPFDTMAPVAVCEVTLRNPDGRFSPEDDTSVVEIGHGLRVLDDGLPRFVGAVARIDPAPGDHGPRTAVIIAECPLRALVQGLVRLPLQVNARADAIVGAVLDAAPARQPSLDGRFIVGSGALLGIETRLGGDAYLRSLQTGISIFPYVGDTWDDGVRADDAVRETVEAEGGRLFSDREGRITLFNRHETLKRSTTAATFSDSARNLLFDYGVDTVNRVVVAVTPREIGSEGDVIWTLTNPVRVPGTHFTVNNADGNPEFVPGQNSTVRFVARFRDSASNRIGAVTVIQPAPVTDYALNREPDGSGGNVTFGATVTVIEASGSAALIEVRNGVRETLYLLAGSQLRGTPLFRGDPLTVEATDHTSETFYGPRTLVFDLPALADTEEAQNLAIFELLRRRTPRGTVREMTLDRADAGSLNLFDRVRIADSQTGHMGDCLIVGEAHDVTAGGYRHRVTWTLEPVNPGQFWLLGTSLLGVETGLAY